MRSSPNIITALGPKEVFVFGSNLQGRHGRGAAKQALKWGAVYGKGVGFFGRTYAIPTRKFVGGRVDTIGTPYFDPSRNCSLVTIPLSEIFIYILNFIKFCSIHKELTFLVTPIGCSNAGYTPNNIAPLFHSALSHENILLPKCFLDCSVV